MEIIRKAIIENKKHFIQLLNKEIFVEEKTHAFWVMLKALGVRGKVKRDAVSELLAMKNELELEHSDLKDAIELFEKQVKNEPREGSSARAIIDHKAKIIPILKNVKSSSDSNAAIDTISEKMKEWARINVTKSCWKNALSYVGMMDLPWHSDVITEVKEFVKMSVPPRTTEEKIRLIKMELVKEITDKKFQDRVQIDALVHKIIEEKWGKINQKTVAKAFRIALKDTHNEDLKRLIEKKLEKRLFY